MAIKIITDSTSDIPFDLQGKLGIEIVPLSVHFGSEEYIDGITLTKPEFYRKLTECKELPTTAQVNPEQFEKVFQKNLDAGDEIVGIFLSSKLSGTLQSAEIAKGMLNTDKIHLIDSLNVTYGLALLVYEAVRMRDEGRSAQEVCDGVKILIGRLKFYIVLDTLKYLKMGGRLSSSAAFLGTMLHIRPIISLVDGAVVVLDKTKGQKASVEWILDKTAKDQPDLNHKVVYGHSVAPDFLVMLQTALNEQIKITDSTSVEMGAVVGTHGGPKCVGLAYIAKADGE
jgi:DegV family protein with EDD domain